MYLSKEWMGSPELFNFSVQHPLPLETLPELVLPKLIVIP